MLIDSGFDHSADGADILPPLPRCIGHSIRWPLRSFGISGDRSRVANTPVRAAGLYRQGVGSRPDSDAVQNLHRIIPLFPVDFGGGLYRLIHSSVGQLVTSNHVAMTDETAVRFSIVTCPHHFCSSSPFGTGAGISCTKMNRT